MFPRWLVMAVTTVVTLIWAASTVASMAPWLDYEADRLVHVVFMMVVGGALGFHKFLGWDIQIRRRDSDDRDDPRA